MLPSGAVYSSPKRSGRLKSAWIVEHCHSLLGSGLGLGIVEHCHSLFGSELGLGIVEHCHSLLPG